MAQSNENAKVYDGPVQKHQAEDTTHGKLLHDSTVPIHSLAGIDSASQIRLSDVDPSSPESIKKADGILDSKVSGLLPPADQNLLKNMSHAIVEGDSKALGDAIASMKDDPAKLKSFVGEVQKNLNQSDAGVNISVTKDGNVVVYKDNDSAGVQYDSKTGKPSVVPIEHQDGNVILGQGEVLNKTPDDVAKDIGLSAREGILGLNLKLPSIFDQIPGGKVLFPGGERPNAPGGTNPDFPHGSDGGSNQPGGNLPGRDRDPGWNPPIFPGHLYKFPELPGRDKVPHPPYDFNPAGKDKAGTNDHL